MLFFHFAKLKDLKTFHFFLEEKTKAATPLSFPSLSSPHKLKALFLSALPQHGARFSVIEVICVSAIAMSQRFDRYSITVLLVLLLLVSCYYFQGGNIHFRRDHIFQGLYQCPLQRWKKPHVSLAETKAAINPLVLP